MKAQFVYENLDFERGLDPKTSLGIGKVKILEKIDSIVNPRGYTPQYKLIDDKNYKGCIVAIYRTIHKTLATNLYYYTAWIRYPRGPIQQIEKGTDTAEIAWEMAKNKIKRDLMEIESEDWGSDPPPFF
jgi:hypothetical protein